MATKIEMDEAETPCLANLSIGMVPCCEPVQAAEVAEQLQEDVEPRELEQALSNVMQEDEVVDDMQWVPTSPHSVVEKKGMYDLMKVPKAGGPSKRRKVDELV